MSLRQLAQAQHTQAWGPVRPFLRDLVPVSTSVALDAEGLPVKLYLDTRRWQDRRALR